MNRLQRLEPIKDLAERREKQAAQAFGESRQKLEAGRKSLNSLVAFRESYSQRFNLSGNQGLGVRRLQEYRAFLDKINKAIADQEQQVQRAERELEEKKRLWEEAHGRVLGMQTLCDKLNTEAYKLEQKREQGEYDDRASRRNGGKTSLSMF
ncbi:flagellar export protein FliJ [Methylococcus sp. EFPC2]|uniref:flagellar export protein FliJ n=1 Tax=Methylococcus sp. EFPC2 TaxID=2812648 RepID=UPI001968191F|nr:flagellar export protein FliJ [Methylococcus sp. EFPC2]QSA98538.1 flagellar export protein FliJ [Methylococcus sp. EFPC2]